MARIQLVYASAATVEFSPDDLARLLTAARGRNGESGITGILLYRDGSFFQVLEGDEEDVETLFERIEQDGRHERVVRLLRREQAEPNFGEWRMGFVDLGRSAQGTDGFVDFFRGSFLGLAGDAARVEKLLDAFRGGAFRQHVSS